MSSIDGGAAEPAAVQPVAALVRRSGAYLLAAGAQAAAMALALPAATRVLGTAQFGHLATAIVVFQLATVILSLGIPGAITREVFLDHGGQDVGRGRALLLAGIVASCTLAALGHLLSGWWGRIFAGDSHSLLVLALWIGVPGIVVQMVQSVLRAQERALAFGTLSLVAAVGGHLAGLVAAYTVDATAYAYLWGFGCGTAAAALVGLVLVPPTARGLTRSLVASGLHIGLPTVPHALAVFLLAAGDRILIERSRGVVEVGRYQVAYTVGALVITGVIAVNNAWAPMLYGAAPDQRSSTLRATTEALLVTSAGGAASLSLVAPLLLGLVAPAEYRIESLVSIVGLVAVSVVPYVLYLSSTHVLGIARKVWPLAWLTPLAAAFSLALCAVLVDRRGLAGAAVATIGGYVFWALLVRGSARRLGYWSWDLGSVATAAVVAVLTLRRARHLLARG